LTKSQPTLTRRFRSPKTVDAPPIRLVNLDSRRIGRIRRQLTPAGRMFKARKCTSWMEGLFLTHRPSLLPRNDAAGGSGMDSTSVAVVTMYCAFTASMLGGLGYLGYSMRRDHMSRREREEAQVPTEPSSQVPPEPAPTEADSQAAPAPNQRSTGRILSRIWPAKAKQQHHRHEHGSQAHTSMAHRHRRSRPNSTTWNRDLPVDFTRRSPEVCCYRMAPFPVLSSSVCNSPYFVIIRTYVY